MKSGLVVRIIAAAFVVTACEPEPTPAEKAAADAKAVAMVEAAQDRHPPPQPLAPQSLTLEDIDRFKLFGAGCRFEPEGRTEPVLLTRSKQAIMKLDRRLVTFASDPGGPQLPLGTWEHYVGKGWSLRITKGPGDGIDSHTEDLGWPATLTVRDQYDRVVYATAGELRCGA